MSRDTAAPPDVAAIIASLTAEATVLEARVQVLLEELREVGTYTEVVHQSLRALIRSTNR
ncbi:hypothetical protein ACWD04_26690 [Streptomyces sp. NPDC002911]